MSYFVLMQYLGSAESFNIESGLCENGFEYGSVLVKAQKQILKKFDMQQSGHTVIHVEEDAAQWIKSNFPNTRMELA